MSGEKERKLKKLTTMENWHNVIDHLRPALPITNKKFDKNLNQVGINYLQGGGEYAGFQTGDRSKFTTYGYDDTERKEATLTFDATRNGFTDQSGNIVEVSHRVYNVTREGQLIIQNAHV